MFIARPDDGVPARGNKLRLQPDVRELIHEPSCAVLQLFFVLVIGRNTWKPKERIIILNVIIAHGHKLIGFLMFAYDFRPSWTRIKYTIEASARTTTASRRPARVSLPLELSLSAA